MWVLYISFLIFLAPLVSCQTYIGSSLFGGFL